jgi:hypothetical protein
MAFVPNRFRPKVSAAALFPTFDRLFSNNVESASESVQGAPFTAGGAYHLAFCQVWAPPFELDELELIDD